LNQNSSEYQGEKSKTQHTIPVDKMIKIHEKTKTQYIELKEIEKNWVQLVPKNIWLYIFSYLATSFELTKAALVCKKWCMLANDNSLWKRIVAKRWPSYVNHSLNAICYKGVCFQAIRDLRIFENKVVCPLDKLSRRTSTPIMSFSLCGTQVFIATKEGKIQIFNVESGKKVKEVSLFKDGSEFFHVMAIAVFKNHITCVCLSESKFELSSQMHILTLERETLKEMHRNKFPAKVVILAIDEDFIYFKHGLKIYVLESQKTKPKMIFKVSKKTRSLISNQQVCLQNENKDVAIYHLPSGELMNSLSVKGKLLQVDEDKVFTISHDPSLILRIYDLKTCENIKSINLQQTLHYCFESRVLNAVITGGLLAIRVDYKLWLNSYGQIVMEDSEEQAGGGRSLILIDKDSGDIVRAVEFSFSANEYAISDKGQIVLSSNRYPNQIQTIDLLQEVPEKKCIIL